MQKRIKPGPNQRSIILDPTSKVTLARQLYERLRELILSGELAPGERLLSTRELSEITGVSRPTVSESYDRLLQEGYLEARPGSGTYVSSQLPKHAVIETPQGADSVIQRRLSLLGHRLNHAVLEEPSRTKVEISFYSWRPSTEEKQADEWSRIWFRTARTAEPNALDLQIDPLGYKPLRQAIARDVAEKRMIRCDSEDIILLESLPQAIDFICRLHVDRGDRVATEDPGYPQFREIASLQGADVLPISVDDEGVVVEELTRISTAGLKLIYLTPSHQCPTGAVLSLPRRLALLEWAHRNGVVLIEDEDDFETDNCYGDRPLSALMGLDRYGSVVYIGSLSKLISPFFSLTYLVVPPSLRDTYARARRLMGAKMPITVERCLTEFLNQGSLKSQIRRMREDYDARRKALVAALNKHFGDRVSIASSNAGVYLLVNFSTNLTTQEIQAKAAAEGVGIISTAAFYAGDQPKPEFILGYGDLDKEQILEGVKRLARALD